MLPDLLIVRNLEVVSLIDWFDVLVTRLTLGLVKRLNLVIAEGLYHVNPLN